jgi:hypothetical protein
VNKFIVLYWVVIVTALLYLHGLLSIEEQNKILHTAEVITGPPSYQDILIGGYHVFLTLPMQAIMLLPPFVLKFFFLFSLLFLSYPLPRQVTNRLYFFGQKFRNRKFQERKLTDLFRHMWAEISLFRHRWAAALKMCDWEALSRKLKEAWPTIVWVLFWLTLVLSVGMFAALQRGESLLLKPRPDMFLFGKHFPFYFSLWAGLLIGTFVFLWCYVRERITVTGKAMAGTLGLLWFLLQMNIFARATGFFVLRESGVPEIEISAPTQPSLNKDKSRVFLLGQTADRYVLLTIAKLSAEREIVVIRKEQVQMFTMTTPHMDLFKNSVSAIK